MPENQQGFKDSTRLTKWTVWILYAQVVVGVVAILFNLLEYQVLVNLKNDAFPSPELADAAAEASDTRQAFIGIIQALLFFTSIVLVLKWIYRANDNARRLGAEGMTFTPGWSVGWYFIPILSSWKPYQAMKEIWKASVDPQSWKPQSASSLLPWWWFFWIVSNILGQAAFRLILRAEEIDELITSNIVTQLSDISDIPLTLILIAIISRIYKMQTAHAAKPVGGHSFYSGEPMNSIS
ncbi:MAG: DUF4328 domain-containing protein [Burkholderiales bacterium]|jgi:hypothetical protein|nr:DUF4328 domain-containing protein [Burkholderiales bacterium]